MPTETNGHGDALCFVDENWAWHKTTETVLNDGWRLAAVGGWRLGMEGEGHDGEGEGGGGGSTNRPLVKCGGSRATRTTSACTRSLLPRPKRTIPVSSQCPLSARLRGSQAMPRRPLVCVLTSDRRAFLGTAPKNVLSGKTPPPPPPQPRPSAFLRPLRFDARGPSSPETHAVCPRGTGHATACGSPCPPPPTQPPQRPHRCAHRPSMRPRRRMLKGLPGHVTARAFLAERVSRPSGAPPPPLRCPPPLRSPPSVGLVQNWTTL